MENKGLHTTRCPSYLLISAPYLIKGKHQSLLFLTIGLPVRSTNL